MTINKIKAPRAWLLKNLAENAGWVNFIIHQTCVSVGKNSETFFPTSVTRDILHLCQFQCQSNILVIKISISKREMVLLGM